MDQNRPADITALSLFFVAVALVCAVAGIMLLFSSGELHPLWRSIAAIAAMGTEAVSWLVIVGILCVVAALGLWRCSYWGYLTACVLLILAFAVHFLRALVKTDLWGILTIVTIGALLLWYLRSRAHIFLHRGS